MEAAHAVVAVVVVVVVADKQRGRRVLEDSCGCRTLKLVQEKYV